MDEELKEIKRLTESRFCAALLSVHTDIDGLRFVERILAEYLKLDDENWMPPNNHALLGGEE